jgi:hypothetical protein
MGQEYFNSTYLVASRVTVVGAAKRRDAKAIVLDGIAVLPHLVRANDGSDLVELTPTPRDIGAKAETNTLCCVSLQERRNNPR